MNTLMFINVKSLVLELLIINAIISAILVIISKNPVISVVFLISLVLNSALFLIAKGMPFLGISYILVYLGAIIVLFLFVIMMINVKLTDILETGYQYTKNIPLALAIGSLFIYEIFTITPFTFSDVSLLSTFLNILTNLNGFFLDSNMSSANIVFNAFNPVNAETTFANFLQVQAIGQSLYTIGAFWLIITSLILLLAMVAPIFISKKSTNK